MLSQLDFESEWLHFIFYVSHNMYYILYLTHNVLHKICHILCIVYILYNLYRILSIFEGIPHQWSMYGSPPPRVCFPHPNCSSHQESMCGVPPSSTHFFSMVSPPLLLNHKSSPTCISKCGTPSWAFLSDVYGCTYPLPPWWAIYVASSPPPIMPMKNIETN